MYPRTRGRVLRLGSAHRSLARLGTAANERETENKGKPECADASHQHTNRSSVSLRKPRSREHLAYEAGRSDIRFHPLNIRLGRGGSRDFT
jgi:hypothetical protein